MPCFNCIKTKLLSDAYFQLLLKPHLVTITSYSLSPLKAQSEGVFFLLYRNNSRSYFSNCSQLVVSSSTTCHHQGRYQALKIVCRQLNIDEMLGFVRRKMLKKGGFRCV